MQYESVRTGLDLKVERTRARVKGTVLAREMGISTSRLSKIEDQPSLTERMRDRYLVALETCRTFGTSAGES